MRTGRTWARHLRAAVASGAVAAAAGALAAPAPAADYVAMGDSYSSGTGTREYFDSNCERSNFAYSKLIDPQIPGDWNMVACGGARTQHITTSGQNGNPPQAQHGSVGAGTEYVTISIGGNDAGFTDVLLECGQPGWLSDCNGAINTAQSFIQNELPGRLNSVLDTIRSRTAPSTIVTLVGYPRLFNGEDCNALTFFDSGEMQRLNQTADLLADVMRTQARENGYAYADARGAYLGHAVCDSTEWLNGLSNPVGESYHPNKLGHQGYAGIVRAALLAAAPPDFSRGPNGRIAFARENDVWVMNGNGQFPVNLTESISDPAIDPVWSPDGTKLAFASGPTDAKDIYVLDFDNGGAPQRLTTDPADDRDPTWSPNGKYIAFRSARTGNNDIYKMRADGTEQTRLTANTDSEFAPDWSPDGAEIVYQRCCQNDVWKMNADGQGQTRLTTDGGNDGRPHWSPSGHQIAFHSNRDGDFEIFTMTPTGGSQTQRTSNSANDQDPSWSPNGAQIVFRSEREGNSEIYTMTATGGSQTRRTNASAHDATPSWQGDKTPPDTQIEGELGEGDTTSRPTPSFDLVSNEPGSSFECRAGNPPSGNFTSCSSPHTTAALADGPNTLEVRAIDPSGNVDPTPATRTFIVDTTPAATAITAGPPAITNVNAPTFEFSSEEEADHFECRLDSSDEADFAECESPFTAPPLADGEHTFEVRSVDSVGNPSQPESLVFVVDTVAPDTSFVSAPANPTNIDQPSFEFSSSEPGSTFECRLDETDWEDCASPFTAPEALADGEHSFEVRATDPAHNVDASPASVVFEIDTVAPDAAIDSGPPEFDPEAEPPPPATADPTPELTFSSADATASFECRVDSLDDADWNACESPFESPALDDGQHLFQVRAVDGAGNAGAPAERTFIVDLTSPSVTIESPATLARISPEHGPNFVFSSNDPYARFECRLDGDPAWRDCEPDQALADIFDGDQLADESQRTFSVRAIDSVENVSPTPAVRQFHLDPNAPYLEITGGPANGARIKDNAPTFSFRSGDGKFDRFECAIDGRPWVSCGMDSDGGSYTAPTLADGEHTFDVRAIDQARNRTTKSRTFIVDTVPPRVSITSGPSGLTRRSTPSFAFRSSAGATLACSFDGGAFAPCESPHQLKTPLSDGSHSFAVRATDAAGNAATRQRLFTVDTQGPVVAITSGPSAGQAVAETMVTFGFTSPDAAGYECRIDGAGDGGFTDCKPPFTTPELDNGAHTFAVRAVDAVGNPGPVATRAFTVSASRSAPGVDFRFGKLRRNAKRGTATIAVTVNAAGTLKLSGRGVKKAVTSARPERAARLAVKPKPKLASKLKLREELKMKVTVRLRSDGGAVRTKATRLKLVSR